MENLIKHLPRLIHESRTLWMTVKLAALLNVNLILLFGLLDPGTRIYRYMRSSTSGFDEIVLSIFIACVIFLWHDFVAFDKTVHARRHWFMEKAVPFVYMLIGSLFLGLSFSAAVDNVPGLSIAYLANATFIGLVAYITKVRLSWSTE